MGRLAKGRGQVTHHVSWGSGCLPGAVSMSGSLHSHLTRTNQTPFPSGETATTQRRKWGSYGRVPSPRLKVQASVGGEVVAGWRGISVGGKKSALNGGSKEELGADGYRGFKPVMLMARAFEVQLRAGSPHLQREGGQRFGQGKGSLAWLTGLELIFFFPWQEFASWSCYVAGKAAPSQASSHF